MKKEENITNKDKKQSIVTLVLIPIILAIIMGIGLTLNKQEDVQKTMYATDITKPGFTRETETSEKATKTDSKSSEFVQEIKSKEEFEKIKSGSETVLVDYYASWCGPCKVMSPLVEKIAKEKGLKVVKVNVDDPNLRNIVTSEGVRYLPTFKTYKENKEIDTKFGVQSEEDIISMYKNI